MSHVAESYERAVGGKRHENPKDAYDSAGKPAPLDPNSRIIRLDWVRRGSTSILFAFSLGKNDGFADAMSAQDGDPDVSIEHLAPRRQFRGVYVFPPAETQGVLVLECISRSCPIVPLKRWSRNWGKELEMVDPKSKFCRMSFEQMTDDSQVRELIRNGEPQEIVLSEHASAGIGLPSVTQYRLSAPVKQRQNAMSVVRKWAKSTSKTTMDEGIVEAKALIGPKVADVDFDDCYVSVKHEGQVKNVRPDAYSELFTYDNRIAQRSTDEYFRLVQAKLAALGLAREMSLDLRTWPTDLPELGRSS
ncbi:hypothetical protein J7E74_14965 [Rhodococcus erythropolis]|nr:hypothetical protein [Rhodococcus erythropolis]